MGGDVGIPVIAPGKGAAVLRCTASAAGMVPALTAVFVFPAVMARHQVISGISLHLLQLVGQRVRQRDGQHIHRPVFRTGFRGLPVSGRAYILRRGRTGRCLRTAPCKRHRAYRRRHRQGCAEGGGLHFSIFRNSHDTLLHSLFVRSHRGGGKHHMPRRPLQGDEPQQSLPVWDALGLAQPSQGALVAGQLAVLPGGGRRPPDQRIKPVHRQTYAPQQGPQRVPMPPVGLLMGQHMTQARPPLHGGGRQIHGRPEQPEEARRYQPLLHQIHRIPAFRQLHRDPLFPQHVPEPEVGYCQPQPHEPHARSPDQAQSLLQGKGIFRQYGRLALRLGHLGIAALHWQDHIRSCRGARDLLRRYRQHINRLLLQPFLHLDPGGLGDGQHAEIRRRKVRRHQQPHQYQPPEGILYPPGNSLPEDLPQDQQGQDQRRGGQQNLSHFAPPPAFSSMADSSATSASVRRRLSTMALIMSPRLPP